MHHGNTHRLIRSLQLGLVTAVALAVGGQPAGLQESGLQESGLLEAGLLEAGLQDSGVQASGMPGSGMQADGSPFIELRQAGVRSSGLQSINRGVADREAVRMPMGVGSGQGSNGGSDSLTLVGLDARNGADADSLLATGGDFDELRARLVARGLGVVPTFGFSQEDLAGLDLLILQQPHFRKQRFTPAELQAIHGFVTRGGSLLIHGESGGRSDELLWNMNQLLEPLGIRFDGGDRPVEEGGSRVIGEVLDVQGLRSHPVTRGLKSFLVDNPRRMAVIQAPAVDLTWGNGPNDLLAAVDEPNFGRVVILGDASLWMDDDAQSSAGLWAEANSRLLSNILDHLVPGDDSGDPRRGIAPARGQSLRPAGLSVRLEGLRDQWLGLSSAASAVLRLMVPDGRTSGCYVKLSVHGAQPGALLLVLLGEPTEVNTLKFPQLLETVSTDAEGRASFSVLVPYSAEGHSFGLRLLDVVAGESSPVIRFEPRH